MKKVSVILPCYNVELWIDRCLRSLEEQTIGMESLEIICVDDCSNDSTIDHLLQWEQRYPDNFIIINSEQNGRQGQARNIGLQYASTEWIVFIDADDWVEKDYIEKMYEIIVKNNYDIVSCGNGRDFSKELTYFEKSTDSKITEYIIKNIDDRRPLIINPPFGYSAWAKIIRRDFLIENELYFPTNITYEDAAWGSLVHLYVNSGCVIGDKLYHYFVNDESTVLTRNSNHHLDCLTSQTLLWREYYARGFMVDYKYELEIEHIYSAYLPAIKMCILRYEKPDYNIYLLLRELMIDRISDYKSNPYVINGQLSELHKLIMVAFDEQLNKQQFLEFAENIKKIGI